MTGPVRGRGGIRTGWTGVFIIARMLLILHRWMCACNKGSCTSKKGEESMNGREAPVIAVETQDVRVGINVLLGLNYWLVLTY